MVLFGFRRRRLQGGGAGEKQRFRLSWGAFPAAAIAALVFAPSSAAGSQAPRSFVFAKDNVSVAPRVAAPIIVEAYAKLGHRVEFVEVPQVRSLPMAHANELDGELSRTLAVRKSFPNLIRIEPPLYRIVLHFFSRRTDLELANEARLRTYSIGFVRGVNVAAELAFGLEPVAIDDPISLFRMLSAGRLDLGIVPRDNAPLYSIMAGVADVKAIGEPLATEDLFHYLSPKNADIVPGISRVLRSMAETGELDGLRRRALQQIYDDARGGNRSAE